MALPVTLVTLGGVPVQLVDQTGSVFPTTGTGSLVFNTTPTLITPILGAATGTSLALGGASGATLAVTGTANISGTTTMAAFAATGTSSVIGATTIAGAATGNATATFRVFGGLSNSSGFQVTHNSATDASLILSTVAGGTLGIGSNNAAVLTFAATTNAVAISTSLATPIVTSISGSLSVGGAQGTYLTAQGGTKYFAVDNWVAGGSLGGRASSVIGFTSQTTDPDASAPDTAFSRITAGIIGVGTGAAGNVAGSMQMAVLDFGTAGNAGVKWGASSLGLFNNSNNVLAVRDSTNSVNASITAGAATFTGALTVPGVTTAALTSTGTFTSGAGAQVGTLTNAPAAGNPTTWIKIIDNGTTRYIPAW